MNTNEILNGIEMNNLTQEEIDNILDKLCSLNIKSRLALTPKVVMFLKSRTQLNHINREETAKYMNMSSRTLSRKLKKEHTGFHDLLNEERKRRCLYYMRCDKVCGQEIVELLGLSDLSHFYKSFRRWTGHNFSEAKAMMAENHRNIDTIFHRQSGEIE